uniref:NADH-ubiquinone oxidoreductase chain 1 n=2 Tax=Phreagena TaxID=1298644 RepID=A0A3G9DIX5_PHRSO|nr:NADH dehydrogenase subunit 1 [Phreagena soyoae]UFQ25505.1 NADH dehydrogenase subunit 1 [Phreagena soyoae]BBA25613.1 NADH dehydrogenase subunit 1 [Phreagena kilmeri]BBA25653.1 NADH dehydrogenase subunit 1 [Phreagena soyoae]
MVSGMIVVIIMMMSVAFYIVVERKGLGMIQLRQGPNKVSFKGILQPISDGVKLFKKEVSFPFSSTRFMFLLGPFLCFFCAYCLWLIFPGSFRYSNFELGLLFFQCVSSFSVFGVFLSGWVCDSRYGFLGAMRAVAQSVSYEVFLSTCLYCPLLLIGSFDLVVIREFPLWFFWVGQEVMILWLVATLAETNRAPFDFVESESELVAGYSVEYGGVGFALMALAEYSNMLFMSLLVSVLFFSGMSGIELISDAMFIFFLLVVSYFMVWVRGALPRFRYDLLMGLCWEILLPLSLCEFMVLLCVSL